MTSVKSFALLSLSFVPVVFLAIFVQQQSQQQTGGVISIIGGWKNLTFSYSYSHLLNKKNYSSYSSKNKDVTKKINNSSDYDSMVLNAYLEASSKILAFLNNDYNVNTHHRVYQNNHKDNIGHNRGHSNGNSIENNGNNNNAEINEPESIKRLKQTTQQKVIDSIKVISDALDNYSLDEISISFNGGKDCLVMLYLYMAVLHDRGLDQNQDGNYNGSTKNNANYNNENSTNGGGEHATTTSNNSTKINTVYIYYEKSFDKIEYFNNNITSTYNLNLKTYSNMPLKLGFETYLHENPTIKAIIVGNRRSDPFSATLKPFQPTDNDWPSFVRVHPVLEWSYCEIWYFLIALDFPYCELYDLGYTSIGGVCSTVPNPKLEKRVFDMEESVDWEQVRWLSWKKQQNDEQNHSGEIENDGGKKYGDGEFYPAFYLQNEEHERYSRTKYQQK